MKFHKIKSEHIKNIGSLDMKISENNTKQSFFVFWTTNLWYHEISPLTYPYNSSHASQFTKTLSSHNLEGDTLLQIQFFGVPLDPHFSNSYQQKTFAQHKNPPNRKTILYHNLFYHHTIIQIKTHQKKTISYYQYPLEFTLSNIQHLIYQQHPNQMSNLSLTWTLTINLNFLWMLYIPWVLNL